jgi:hypothetical protein
MKTFYISDGKTYRNRKMQKLALTRSDKVYLLKTTNYKDSIWIFFTPLHRSIPDVSMISSSSSIKYPLLIPAQ